MRILPLPLIFGLSIAIAQAQYCIPEYTVGTTDNDYIHGVEINTISNLDNGPGDGSGYSDFTDLSTELFIGITYEVHIANTPDYTEGYRVWIDYNHDNVFSEDEQIFEPFVLEDAFETIMPFTVPMDASIGETRMRVRCSYNSIDFDACSTETYGEAEDYTINILGVTNDIGITDVIDLADNCVFTDHETMQVAIKNFGAAGAEDFEVGFSVDAGIPVMESFPSLLHVDETLSFTFTGTADLSADGLHTVQIWTSWASDDYNGNDTLTIYVLNEFTDLTTGFAEHVCYSGDHVFPTGVPAGGTWSGACIINASTGEMDPALAGGVGATTIVEYAYATTDRYAVVEIPYFMHPLNAPTNLTLGDDDFEAGIPIGFNFTYFDNTYNEIFVSSNGYIGFGTGSSSYGAQHLPDPGNPDNIIAIAWTDLDPTAGGSIEYELQGTAPNRIFIVHFNNVFHYLSDATISGQIILYESSNNIDIINAAIESDGGVVTQGIENNDGTVAFIGNEDYNQDVFAVSNESWRYFYTPCDAIAIDTITFIEAPVVDIADASACFGTTITLDAGPGAEMYVWNTGSGEQSIDVTASGTYSITYYANASCFVSDSAIVTIYPNPVVDLGEDGGICEGTYLNAENTGASYLWNTGDTTQTLFISTSGTYVVDVTTAAGCFNSDTIALIITPLPIASFSSTALGALEVAFTSLSADAFTWLWDFGDGTISTEENPLHTYPDAGSYTVTLVVTNDCGADIFTSAIQVNTGIINNANDANDLIVYPNPADAIVYVELNEKISGAYTIQLFDMTGNLIQTWTVVAETPVMLPINEIASGNYMILAKHDETMHMQTFIKN